jgi:carboxyl-terminal processing protease
MDNMTRTRIFQYSALALACSLSFAENAGGISEKQIERFATAITQVNHYYIKPVSYQQLFDNAIKGMLTSLDPHSDYLSPKDIKELQANTSGEYAGIGVEVIPDNGLIRVVSPFDDTPAQRAGLQPGDIIIQIDEHLIQEMSTDEAINLIKGPAGTSVELMVIRPGETNNITLNIPREVIQVKSVKSALYRNKTAYIKVANFGDHTAENIKNQIEKIRAEHPINGVILDLRNNPGGTLTAAIDTADLFLDKASIEDNPLIVYTRGRLDIDNMDALATPGDIIKNKPLVVLINNGSASASEIVAGAIKDHHRGVIMGTPSFGKGSVQTVIPIDYESAIKLTTALYYTPDGVSIQAHGIIPDVYAPYKKMPKGKEDNSVLSAIGKFNEANLNGHLTSSAANQESRQLLAKKEKQAELAYHDFQLYQALNMVEAMHIDQAIETKTGATS